MISSHQLSSISAFIILHLHLQKHLFQVDSLVDRGSNKMTPQVIELISVGRAAEGCLLRCASSSSLVSSLHLLWSECFKQAFNFNVLSL